MANVENAAPAGEAPGADLSTGSLILDSVLSGVPQFATGFVDALGKPVLGLGIGFTVAQAGAQLAEGNFSGATQTVFSGCSAPAIAARNWRPRPGWALPSPIILRPTTRSRR